MSKVLVAQCENFREVEQQPCFGRLRFRWGQSQVACDTCGAYCGIAVADWILVFEERVQNNEGPT